MTWTRVEPSDLESDSQSARPPWPGRVLSVISSLSVFDYSSGDSLWKTPVSVTSQSSPTTPIVTQLMESPTTSIMLEVPQDQWVKVSVADKY